MAKILIVDDEKIISNSLARVLKNEHQVVVCNNGIEAIKTIESIRDFEIIFLDLLMPEISGADVLVFAKKTIPKVKVFMMTAYGDQLAKEDLLTKGAAKVFSKPFDDITKIPEFVKSELAQSR